LDVFVYEHLIKMRNEKAEMEIFKPKYRTKKQ